MTRQTATTDPTAVEQLGGRETFEQRVPVDLREKVAALAGDVRDINARIKQARDTYRELEDQVLTLSVKWDDDELSPGTDVAFALLDATGLYRALLDLPGE